MSSGPMQTPPISRTSSQSSSKGRHSPNLSLDLSDLPPLIQPSPPSNTLIVTNLQDAAIFAPTTLAHLRALIETHIPENTLHTFSPLRSLRRIILTFYTIQSATSVRGLLDGETLFDARVRVYFGEPTPITPRTDRHLQAPKAEKQFFISPPPSPPAGWESRLEDEPNKEVHADDLASALRKISARAKAGEENVPEAAVTVTTTVEEAVKPVHSPTKSGRRTRSSTIVVYCPEDHGHSPALPNIEVEDTTGEGVDVGEEEMELEHEIEGEGTTRKAHFHTVRPPVELMSDA